MTVCVHYPGCSVETYIFRSNAIRVQCVYMLTMLNLLTYPADMQNSSVIRRPEPSYPALFVGRPVIQGHWSYPVLMMG